MAEADAAGSFPRQGHKSRLLLPAWASPSPRAASPSSTILIVILSSLLLVAIYTMLLGRISLLAFAAAAQALNLPGRSISTASSVSTHVPQYFQTTPELFAGPTATGRAPFLAQTNPVSFGPSVSFVPNAPLETAVPIVGNTQNQSIFQLMGQLSSYFPNPIGFGVDEYPLPENASIVQLQVGISFRYVPRKTFFLSATESISVFLAVLLYMMMAIFRESR